MTADIDQGLANEAMRSATAILIKGSDGFWYAIEEAGHISITDCAMVRLSEADLIAALSQGEAG